MVRFTKGVMKTMVAAAFVVAVGSTQVFADPYHLSYGGRMTDTKGKPLDGPVDLEVRFFRGETGGSALGPGAVLFNNVTLKQGVYSVNVDLTSAELHQIFPDAEQPVYIEIKDVTHDNVYPRQQLTAMPYALKVPIDGNTLEYDSSGRLQVNPSNLGIVGGSPTIGTTSGTVAAGDDSRFAAAAKGPASSTDNAVVRFDGTTGKLVQSSSVSIDDSGKINAAEICDETGSNCKDISTGWSGSFSGITSDVSFSNSAARSMTVDRTTAAATAGRDLTIGAGGARSTGTNLDGGKLVLQSGVATGAGNSTIEFKTAGGGSAGTSDASSSTKMSILGDGRVGVGTTSPTQLFDVAGKTVIDSTGKVGIGTTAPTTTLHVKTSSNCGGEILRLSTPGGGTEAQAMFDLTNCSGGGNVLSIQAADLMNGYATKFPIALNPSGGNVGIGTSTPAATLEIEPPTFISGGALGNLYGATIQGPPTAIGSATATNAYSLFIGNGSAGAGTTNAYGLFVYAPVAATNKYAAVFQGGNVGIGTTTPASKLDVAGDIALNHNSLLLDDAAHAWNRIAVGTGLTGYERTEFYTYNSATAGFAFGNDGSGWSALTVVPQGGITMSPRVGAYTGVARGATIAPTLTASANSDALTALRIAPTFTPGAFTGVTTNGLIVESGNVGIGTTIPASKLDVDGTIRALEICDEAGANCKDISTGWSSSVTGITSDLSFSNAASRAMSIDRTTTAATAGRDMTISAGGAYSTGTDLAGGKLTLSSGTATGNGASTIEFVTAGGGSTGSSDATSSTKMSILGNGNVGIGTTSPGGRLEIVSAGAGTTPFNVTNGGYGVFSVSNGTGNTNVHIGNEYGDPNYQIHFSLVGDSYFKAMGNVGVGTTAPTEKFHVQGSDSGSVPIAALVTNTSSSGRASVQAKNSSGHGAYLTSYGSGSSILAGNQSLGASNSLYLMTDHSVQNGGSHSLNFMTGGWDSTTQTRMSITSAGNVGIGTTSPANTLSVVTPAVSSTAETMASFTAADAPIGGSKSGLTFRNYRNADAEFAPEIFGYGIGDSNWTPGLKISGQIRSNEDQNTATAVVAFNARQDGGAVSTRKLFSFSNNDSSLVTIDKGGKVGIGTTSPAALLEVVGHIAVSGTAPSFLTCGTSPAVVGNDTRGTVTVGGGSVFGCSLSFATAYATAPFCTVSWQGATYTDSVAVASTTTTALAVAFSADSGARSFTYICLQ